MVCSGDEVAFDSCVAGLKKELHSRGRVHEVLERREDLEHPLGYELEVAVPHVVHEVDVGDVEHNAHDGAIPHVDRRQHGDRKQQVVDQVFSKGVDHSCIMFLH